MKVKGQSGGQTSEATRQLEAARRLLETHENPLTEVDMNDLIRARHQAEYAASQFKGLMNGQSELKRAQAAIKALTKALKSLCMTVHDDAYCDIKSAHPEWPDVVLRSVRAGRAVVGMTTEQLFAAWGDASGTERRARGTVYCFSEDCERFARVMGDIVVEVKDATPSATTSKPKNSTKPMSSAGSKAR